MLEGATHCVSVINLIVALQVKLGLYPKAKFRFTSPTKIFPFQTRKILIVVRFCTAYASVKEIKA